MTRMRLKRMLVAAVLTLAIGGAAAAEQPAGSGYWFEQGVARIGTWWSTLWISVGAASEAAPEIDPDGVQAAPEIDPDGLQAAPEIDPNGTQASPELDPNG